MKGEVNPGMESVRKLVSGRLKTQSAGPHPDADLLSAFAENALPEAERKHLLAHLADCGGCREVVFLSSLPQPADQQKVLIPPPRRWHMSWRWGSAVASIVILAGVFAARRELSRRASPLHKSAASLQLPSNREVAAEKIPSDLYRMSAAPSQKQAVNAPMPPPEQARPDLKHMTAKMQRTLTFGQSDEVQVSPAASANLTANNGAIRDLPRQGPDMLDLRRAGPAFAPKALTANAINEKDQSEVALVPNNETALVESGARAMGKQAALKPHLAGTVFDASGAVVPNAKVTTVGPVGTETVTSDAQGRFAFDVLTPGLYSVKADARGFAPVELKQVAIAANQSPSLKLTLAPGATSETVEVSGQAAAFELSPADEISPNAVAARKKAESQKTGKAATANNTVAAPVPTLQWTLSPMGAVQSSNDGGKTWQMVAAVANISFRALSAVGASVWVGGSGGILYHTLDAGHNWTSIVPANQGQTLSSDITRIEFLDLRDGILSTSSGEIWITHDGGSSWERN